MEPNAEPSLIPRPSHDVIAPQTAENRILGQIVGSSLFQARNYINVGSEAFGRDKTSTACVRLPIPNAVRRVDGSYETLGYEPLEAVGCTGFIDENGKVAIQPAWDFAEPFQAGLAAICQGKKWGFIDKDGTIVVPTRWDAVGRFSEGLASVREGATVVYIDQEGNRVFESKYPCMSLFSEGRALVMKFMKPEWKYGFIDRNGSLIGELRWDYVESFAEVRAIVRSAEKYGFIGRDGEVVIDPHWEVAMSFSEGLAPVRYKDHWGFIGTSGEVAIVPQWSGVLEFVEGIACVQTGESNKAKHGYVNQHGDIVSEPQWEWTCPFSEGLGCIQKGWKRGFVDRNGATVIKPQVDFAGEFLGGLAWVQMGTKWGFINRMGDIVVPFNWDSEVSYQIGHRGPIYRLLIRQVSRDRAAVVWLDPQLNTIWQRELFIQSSDITVASGNISQASSFSGLGKFKES
jgi:hypothetical protein